MKKTVSHHKKQSRMLVLVLGVALLGLFPGLTAADMLQKYGMTLKKNFGPQIMLDQTLFNVNIPLAISNLPGAWKNAKLHAMVAVIFMDAAGEMVGYGLAEGGQEFIPLDITLDNGSYNGTAVASLSGCRWARLQAKPAASQWYWLSWEISSCLSALQRVVPHPIPGTARA